MEKWWNRILALPALISAGLMIYGEYEGPAILVYVTKPLTMGFIIGIAVRGALLWRARYGLLIVVGLLLSLAGDILLMLPSDAFMEGLIAFLLAHLVYIAAFVGDTGWRGSVWRVVPLLVYGGLVAWILWPHLGDMRLPVAVYMVVILGMGWRAGERYVASRQPGALLALLGALLFIGSDTILALNRYGEPFPAARGLNLSTYFLAQGLIAWSVGLPHRE
jgi:uncharacterized membrane protein YhhN